MKNATMDKMFPFYFMNLLYGLVVSLFFLSGLLLLLRWIIGIQIGMFLNNCEDV